MKAKRIFEQRLNVKLGGFVSVRIFEVPDPVLGSAHGYKYSLAYVVDEVCVLRYDNEAGKGDHKHVGLVEEPYRFSTPAALLADFWGDVNKWRKP